MEQSGKTSEQQTPAAPSAPQRRSAFFSSDLRSLVRDLVIAVCLAMVIIIFLYQPVKVEGTSMAPLLDDQQRIFVNKLVYRYEPIRRGDVVVFWYPVDRSKSFIKRVVGLPGETLEIRRGRVYIDGRLLDEPYVPARFADGAVLGPQRVPEGHYFLLGDHRSSSNDSRVFGPVPAARIYGKAVFAYWPVDRFGSIPEQPSQLR